MKDAGSRMNGLKVVFIGLLFVLTTALSPAAGRIAPYYGCHSSNTNDIGDRGYGIQHICA